MTILERLKLELNNVEYLNDQFYTVFLNENNLNETFTYIKASHQREMLYTIIDIFEAILNDTNLMRRVETELIKTDSAYKFLTDRIQHIKNRIYDISTDDNEDNFTLLFSRG